jgi:hypothetical protein
MNLPDKKGIEKESYSYRKWKGCCRRRSAIEARISHLKYCHKLDRNYLKGALGDLLNGMLAGIGYNLHLLVIEIRERLKKEALYIFLFFKMKLNERWDGSSITRLCP